MSETTEKIIIFFKSKKSDSDRNELYRLIWDKYNKRLLYFIRTYSYHNSEDLLHEIFIKIFENLHKYNPVYSFRVWIFTIAKNHCLNFLKQNKRLLSMTDNTIIEATRISESDLDYQMIKKQNEENIRRFLNGLHPDYQSICYLKFYENLKYQQISKIMDIPVGTIKSRLNKIRSDLKIFLGEVDETE